MVAAATANAANIKASAGRVYGYSIFNNSTLYPVFVKLYNTAGTPTVGTGVVQTIGVQAGESINVEFSAGITYSTGIGISITKGITFTDATAVALSDCVVNIFYK